MGKKDEPKDGEEYEFVPPDFDEDAFIHKELSSFRITAIIIAWGIVAGLIGWLAWTAMGGGDGAWFAILCIAMALGYGMKYLLPKLGADIRHYGRKEWLGAGFQFSFTWIAVLLIALNPPISDHADPQMLIYLGPPAQEVNGTVTLDLFAVDNEGHAALDLRVTRDGAIVNLTDPERLQNGHRRITLSDLEAGRYQVQATASDGQGHAKESMRNFTVGDVVTVESDAILELTRHEVRVKLPDALVHCTAGRIRNAEACVLRVTLDNGVARIPTLRDTVNGGWVATKEYPGWLAGNNTYRVHVEMADRYYGKEHIPGRDILSGEHNVRVPAPGNDPPEALEEAQARAAGFESYLEQAPMRQVPGLEAGLVLVGLLGGALFVRRR